MKVLIFSTAYLPFLGGAELAIKEITDRLGSSSAPTPSARGGVASPRAEGVGERGSTESARGRGSTGGSEGGISFSLITARFRRGLPRHERLGTVDVHRVGFGTPFDKWLLPFFGFSLAKRQNGVESFTAIWAMMASQASVAAARFKNCFLEKRLVLTLQEGDEEEHLKRYVFGIGFLYRLLIRPWHTLVFKKADAITAISNYLAERARRVNPRVPVTVVPNGVSVSNFQFPISNFQKEELKEKLGVKPEERVVITTSRLVEKNGIGDLIEAMQYLPEDVKLVICGSGPLERSYKLKAKSYKLENRIRFVGYVPHDELPPYLWASDIFCRPSRSEGLGISFLEAMAAGVPVVATPVGGIPDFLISPSSSPPARGGVSSSSMMGWWEQEAERITGLFCRAGDPKDIAAKIQLLLSNDELRNRITSNASNMVREKYGWDGIARAMRKVFRTS